jgi:murein DD-endopeptidase MepM/ murein hydrolase activator NlpD
MSKFKIISLVVVTALFSWGGYTAYNYFFDASCPVIILEGIQDGGSYAGDVQAKLLGSDEYKVGRISVILDQEVLVKDHAINKAKFEYAFPVATSALQDGRHTLKVVANDGSYKKNSTTKEVNFTVDNVPLRAAFATSDTLHKIFQGKTLHVQFQVNKPIKEAYSEALSKKYACVQEGEGSPIYECFIPIRSDENPTEHLLTITITDLVGNTATLTNKLQVIMYPFKQQRLAVKTEKLQEEAESGLPEQQFEVDVARVSQESKNKKKWNSAFYVPCDMSGISTAFGTLRTTQSRGKYRHDAIDLLATPRSVIWASQDGVVVIKERYAHSGNTIVLDHGCGVLSIYFHLEDFAPIGLGDVVKKGKPVGTLGMTGYATGYHLHWELRVNNVPVDPMQWTKHDF